MYRLGTHIRQYFRWYLLLVFIFLAISLWFVAIRENREGVLTFAVLDIGQGDALFIESPTGMQVIVDGGPNKTLLKEISKVMPWYDRHIDMIVVTNPDKDHFEGFIPLLKKYKVDVVLESGTTNESSLYSLFKKTIEDKNIPKIIARRGQLVDLGGGATLSVLFPDRDVSGLSANDGSLVMKLVYKDTSILLTGDTTARIEEYLVGLDGESLQSTIYKAGHHGSKTSNMEAFVELVDPEWTIISSGANNSYGHPNKETLDTMEKLNIPTYDTCNNGRFIFESDGEKFILKNKNTKNAIVGCKE